MKLVKKPEGHYELVNEVGSLICPFRNPITIQQHDQLQVHPLPCGSMCPHFKINLADNLVRLTCGGYAVDINFDDITEQKIHTNNLGIIK
jgi:hypothetical protein